MSLLLSPCFRFPPAFVPLGSFGADFDRLMAPGMGLGAAGAEHYLGSPFLSVLLCECADELLSQNLTSAVRIHCVCKWICKKKYFLKVLRIALY